MDKIELAKHHVKMALDAIEGIEHEDRTAALLQSINSNMLQLLYSHKDAYTIKEVKDRTGISVKTLYRFEKEGILKTISTGGMKKIVTREDLTNFLTLLKSRG